jgi:4-hydroxybenzoate polyprenyltransferase
VNRNPFVKILQWCELIKLEHTVFALPFAMVGLISATANLPKISVVIAVIVAFTGARAAAMSLNRLIDAKIDGKNLRTQDRLIPKGLINKWAAFLFAVLSFVVMMVAASFLPPLCLKLSPVAIVWLSFYSFTKRFTWLCHFVLGTALGGAALGGWIAAGGGLLCQPPWILALAVATWVAGFDIIYACQDVEFDKRENLYSLPAKFGIRTALIVSSILHVMTICGLAYFGLLLKLGLFFWCGVSLIAVMLVWEHSLVRPNDLSKVNAAFFNINGIVSILAFLAILIDKCIATM